MTVLHFPGNFVLGLVKLYRTFKDPIIARVRFEVTVMRISPHDKPINARKCL